MGPNSNVKLYGTREASDAAIPVRLGPLSFLYSAEAVRRVCWHGAELVRAVTWPIRDENWGTYVPRVIDQQHESTEESFRGDLSFSIAEGRLDCSLNITATNEGEIQFDLTMAPADGAFRTNRAGFTVLHPIRGIAGTRLAVTHSDGQVEQTLFPRLISPDQPVLDIKRLAYDLGDATTEIDFSGEIFEMEDQRNWSDASYKTYCVPLVHPFTYSIDSPKRQSVRISLSGTSMSAEKTNLDTEIRAMPSDEQAPEIGLAVQPGWTDTSDGTASSGIGYICARVRSTDPEGYLKQLSESTHGRELDLEFVIPDGVEPLQAMEELRKRIDAAGLAPRRFIALSEAYLASHQPSGPWPDGPRPSEIVAASRETFPESLIGGGMMTNFTEFNRCRPDPALCDYVTHANTAIVHASDDLSVCETLETLPQVFESARTIGDGKPYRLGLVSIGMRSNPYGAAVAENPEQIRRTMAREDPRQRGLFAAAWAVGVLAATEGQQVEALCLGAPSGPFSIAYAPQPYQQAYFDEAKEASVYPLFHVVKAAAAMAGHRRLNITGMPAGIFAFGAETSTGTKIMLANVSPEETAIRLAQAGHVAILDRNTFIDATTQADWLSTVTRHNATSFELEGFAVAFIE